MTTLRTTIYVDGFNLYYGCLKRLSRYRWLDVAALFDHLINESTTAPYKICSVKYFTAPILPRLSPHGNESMGRQTTYWRALEVHPPNVEIVRGMFYPAPGNYYADQNPLDMDITHKVIRPEEKQTDVNVALHMLLDAQQGKIDQQVLISNDSDYEPVFKMIRKHYPDSTLGWIPPIMEADTCQQDRQPNAILREHAHWSRWPLTESGLANFQLPEKVVTTLQGRAARTKVFRRPDYWK